ncbi:hypothetical protein E4K67_05410 [Desulfosporosinus fructosivorans]|uniref:Uncharacterized protein n=1 Tax=Desulfosporosinus fructosivorans TaxID=2018669 RepID=A0A4Z0R6Y3_9FIRM|nr:hypothetical protein E4K67_05410 [Desulfosporosinus fructosivorans]
MPKKDEINRFSEGGVYIGLDFFVTASIFSVLGYGLCYLTLSCNCKSKTPSDNSEKLARRGRSGTKI